MTQHLNRMSGLVSTVVCQSVSVMKCAMCACKCTNDVGKALMPSYNSVPVAAPNIYLFIYCYICPAKKPV